MNDDAREFAIRILSGIERGRIAVNVQHEGIDRWQSLFTGCCNEEIEMCERARKPREQFEVDSPTYSVYQTED